MSFKKLNKITKQTTKKELRMDFELNEWMQDLKELTPTEYQAAETYAEKLVLKDIGNEPERKNFERETENQFTDPIFVLIIFIFITVAAVTLLESFSFVGKQVSENAVSYLYGIKIDTGFKTTVEQFGYWLLAEFTLLVTMIMWRFSIAEKERNGFYSKFKNNKLGTFLKLTNKYLDLRLLVAILSMSYILLVNWSSGYHILMRVMIPIISISLGFLIEKYYSEWAIERKRVTKEYNSYHQEWMDINREPNKHPDFQTILLRSIWEKIRSKNARYNIDLDVSGDWKMVAVQRELENANWAKYGLQKQRVQQSHNMSNDEINNMPPLKILRNLMEEWQDGDNPEIIVGDYAVHMDNLVFSNFAAGWDRQAKSVGGLKKIVTSELKGERS